jgi:hypothetical protein
MIDSTKFNVYFFREKTQEEVNFKTINEYFIALGNTSLEPGSDKAVFSYHLSRFDVNLEFILTKASAVPSLDRLNPKYLEIKIHCEFPLVLPSYIAKKMFEVIKNFSIHFHYFVYSEMFEDVTTYQNELLVAAFSRAKKHYLTKYQSISSLYYNVPETKLNQVLFYVDEQLSLQQTLSSKLIYCPNYIYLKNEINEIILGFEWQEGTAVIIPPQTDIVVYSNETKSKVYRLSEVILKINKYLIRIPGFLDSARMINPKKKKKVARIMKKLKLKEVEDKLLIVVKDKILDNME